jgi:hypothetical protein
MLLGPPSGEEKEDLRRAPIPVRLLTLIGWAKGLRLLFKTGAGPLVGCILIIYVVVRMIFAGESPLDDAWRLLF